MAHLARRPNRPRVLLVSEIMRNNVGWSFARLLPELGYDTVVFDERRFLIDDPVGTVARVARKLSRPARALRYNAGLRRVAARIQPDAIIVLKGPLIRRSTLRAIRATTTGPIANYLLDDVFPLDRRAIPQEMHRCLPEYDLVAATKRYNVEELLAAGCKRAVFVRSGYDPLAHHPVEATADEQQQLGSDVLFVGTYERDRAALLEQLAATTSVRLAVFGNGWTAVPRTSPLYPALRLRPLYGREKLAAFATCKIALCFLRKANRDTYTDRSFEIPATGAFMLAERSDEHALLFTEDREIACFDGGDELVARVCQYLEQDEARMRIAAAGRIRLLRGHHTYADRLQQILDLLNLPDRGVHEQ